jgi:2-iminoacetate synthase ThiH
MKSSDTQAYQITAQQKTENIVTSIINQSTEKIINTSDTGKTKAQQIQELEDAIASAKKTYQASLDVIQSSKDLITKLQ